MEEKLAKFENVVKEISVCNLSDEAKKLLLELVREKTFSLRSEISIRNRNFETVFPNENNVSK